MTPVHPMSRKVSAGQHTLTVLLLCVLAMVARWQIVTLDFNSLLTSYLADDAFYYYKIAANIFLQHRISYDGEGLANGFHPLWMTLIVPFYTPGHDGADFVARVQWLMLALHLLAIVVLYLTVLRLRGGWLVAMLASAILCLHSTFVDMQMNGLETSLNMLVLLLLLNAFLTVWLQPLGALRRYVFFGFIAAAAFLTRTDNAITLVLLFAALAWQARGALVQVWPRLFLAGLVALLLVSPWLLWNQLQFGSMVQSSGKVESIHWGEPHFSLGATVYRLLLTPMAVYSHLQDTARLFIAAVPSALALQSALLLAAGALLCWQLLSARNPFPVLRALAVFCLAVFAVFCYNAGMRSFVRIWYHMPVGLVLVLLLAAVAIRWRDQRWPLAGLLLSVVAVLSLHSPAKLPGVAAERSPHFVVADWLNTNTPADAVIGSMNSGILSYLVQRKVVNLDGVVDHRSLRAHWQKRQPEYLRERGIGYLVDNAGALAIFCRDNTLYRCEQVFAFGDPRNPSRVMQVVPLNAEELPPVPAVSTEKAVTGP